MCINLQPLLESIADRSFQGIRKLHGTYHFPRFELGFIKMQGSPGANPASIASVKIALQDSKNPARIFAGWRVQAGGKPTS